MFNVDRMRKRALAVIPDVQLLSIDPMADDAYAQYQIALHNFEHLMGAKHGNSANIVVTTYGRMSLEDDPQLIMFEAVPREVTLEDHAQAPPGRSS